MWNKATFLVMSFLLKPKYVLMKAEARSTTPLWLTWTFGTFVSHKRLVIFNLSGDGRFPDHQHADSTAQLVPGAAAVLLSNGGSGGSAAGAPNPPQSHRQARQHAQVLQHKVCVCVICSVLELSCTLVTICVKSLSSSYSASSQTSLCSNSKLTSAPDRTTYSWKRYDVCPDDLFSL